MEKLKIKLIIICGIALCSCIFAYSAATVLKKFNFNEDRSLDKWAKMVFNGQVDYRIVREGSRGCIKALSDKNCSAMYYRIGFNSQQYPVISWKWYVVKFPDKSKALSAKEKDDFAARLYVIFPFVNFSTSKFIEYVWDEKLPVGTVMDSPVAKNIKQIVVRSGPPGTNEWRVEERNVYDDYMKAFGKKPSLNVGAIAIMCDADNTKTRACSFFGDIIISNQVGVKGRVQNQ